MNTINFNLYKLFSYVATSKSFAEVSIRYPPKICYILQYSFYCVSVPYFSWCIMQKPLIKKCFELYHFFWCFDYGTEKPWHFIFSICWKVWLIITYIFKCWPIYLWICLQRFFLCLWFGNIKRCKRRWLSKRKRKDLSKTRGNTCL